MEKEHWIVERFKSLIGEGRRFATENEIRRGFFFPARHHAGFFVAWFGGKKFLTFMLTLLSQFANLFLPTRKKAAKPRPTGRK